MQINIYLGENLKTLAEADAPVARWLAACNPDPAVVFERLHQNPAGLVDWRMDDGQSLFANLPPSFHYNDWRPTVKAEGGATVIVGTALGYGLNHVLTGSPNSHKILVIEPRPEMLVACLGQTDYRPFLQSGRLQFLPPDMAVIEKALHRLEVSFLFACINLRSDLPSAQLGPEYAALTNAVRAKLESMAVELTTLRQKQEVMVGNELRNYSRAMNDGSLQRVQGAARGLTAVLLGAGPSLADVAPRLKASREKLFLATGLQTLPALELLGLKPDICLGLDFNDAMLKPLENLADIGFAADIPLLYSTKMHPAVLDRYPGPRLPLWTQGGIATYVLQDQELVLDAGGNVGVTLERFLTWAGAERFILAGFDLAWKGASSHVAGHHHSTLVHTYVPGRDIPLTNLHGETIYTHMGFLAAKRDLEKDIAASPAAFFNCYGGGAVIEGAANLTADELTDERLESQGIARQVFLDALLRAARPRTRPVFSPKADSWATSLKNVTRRLEKLVRKAARNQNEIHGALAQIEFFFRHDPIYMPYLYNEIMDMAGLIHTRSSYGVKELAAFKEIRKRVLAKIREVDASLGPSNSWAA